MIPPLRHVPYREQLALLNILSLQARRLRAQLIFVYKMHMQLTKACFNDYFSFVVNKRTRGHSLKIAKKHANNNYRLNFFSVSIIDVWNSLPSDTANAINLRMFKSNLEAFFRKEDIW
jgi:hypothetical protein